MVITDYRDTDGNTGNEYVLQITNNTSEQLYFIGSAGYCNERLVWFVRTLAAGTNGYVVWTYSSGLIWAETGEFNKNTIVRTGQYLPGMNYALLTHETGAYAFKNQTSNNSGSFNIVCDDTIPTETIAVGIGISNHPTFVYQATPNSSFEVSDYKLKTYELAFSRSEMLQGQFFTPADFSNASCSVTFPANQYGAVAVLDSDYKWSVSYQTALRVEES